MAAFDSLARASFAGAEYPVEAVRVKGGLRYHVHEYPHIAGGDLEKLGRRLYEIEMRATFHALANDTGSFGGYGPIWPSRLALLRSLFEAQTTATLVIPTIGRIQACCVEWDQEMVSKVRSGESTSFRFIEDQEAAFAFKDLFGLRVDGLPALATVAQEQLQLAGVPTPLTDEIVNAVDAVLAIGDQSDLLQMEAAAKLELVESLCRAIDGRSELVDPRNWRALDALKDLWLAVQQLANNPSGARVEFGHYLVRRIMTISDVAIAIYGSTDRSVELLQLNPIEDAYYVPPGTSVRYVVPTAQDAAA